MDSRFIELTEYVPRLLTREELPYESALELWKAFPSKINVEFPSPKTCEMWELTSLGWVGHIPLSGEVHVSVNPKVPPDNIFKMLEYTYGFERYRLVDGVVGFKSVDDVFERLVFFFTKRVLERLRGGLYRSYVSRSEHLPSIRERIDIPQHVRNPWGVQLPCRFHDYTADIEDNQIIAWTLYVLSRTKMYREETRAAVGKALRGFQGVVTTKPFTSEDCLGRTYTHLNNDYEELHRLCRFFLDHSGPATTLGPYAFFPFLVDMARLFERFVAAWLTHHVTYPYSLNVQEKCVIEGRNHFLIDLVLYEDIAKTGRREARFVLDTKYKQHDAPLPGDISQVVSYAVAKGCTEAVLVYPVPLREVLDVNIGTVRVRSLSFPIGSDLEKSGHTFLKKLWSR